MRSPEADPDELPHTSELVAQLRDAPVLRTLDVAELRRFAAILEPVTFRAGETVLREGDSSRDLYFIVDGRAHVVRGHVPLVSLAHGAEFGTLGLLTGHPRAATVRAQTFLATARLAWEDWDDFQEREPHAALRITRALVARVREDLVQMTDHVAALLQGRSVPRSAEVEVRLGPKTLRVRTGTPLRAVLPREVAGDLVVGGLLSQKPLGLTTPIFAPAELAPLTLSHWEGRQIYTQSVGLLLLEAAHAVDPKLDVRLGPSRGASQLVELRDARDRDLGVLAGALQHEMERIAATGVPIRREHWTVDEALDAFAERGWRSSAQLLRTWRQGTVPLVSCGQVYVLSLHILMPDVSELRGFALKIVDGELVLTFGQNDPRRHVVDSPPGHEAMAARHRAWLRTMGIESVGGFNELCISGQVPQLIRVAEGFQEKQIGAIADTVAAARDRIRIICIAGPSSSGKTTFIKRLTVQLHIDGVNPIGLSLDDYYVDRDQTVRDEQGEYDFEALEALNLPLLQDHLRRLLAGETVRLARYDFKSGKSHPSGGQELALRPGDMLMLEGIHGLNPALLGSIPRPEQLFRVFVQPSTTLPFDHLTRVSPTDLRLLRRIVRDRHHRGYSAAESILRWPSVQLGERKHIFPFHREADVVFDTALIYEPSVLKVYAERYLLEVPPDHPAYATAFRLRHLIDHFVAIYPDHVPPTSLIREFIGGSGFEY